MVIEVKVDDHFDVDKDACLANCTHCKRTYKVNTTTKTKLTQQIKDKHPNKLVVPVNDPQRPVTQAVKCPGICNCLESIFKISLRRHFWNFFS